MISLLAFTIELGGKNLRSKAGHARVNTGIPYEILVQSIFQEIHDQETLDRHSANTIRVEHDITLPGRTAPHQIDVYWEFSVCGILYKTVVQARDWESRIKQGSVFEFKGVLDDIPGQPRGVIVTRTGFQKGAKAVAEKYGIELYRLHKATRKPITITDIGWATYRLDPANMLYISTFRPDFCLNLSFAPPTLPPNDIRRHLPRELHLSDEKGISVGTVRDILADFSTEMREAGIRSRSFSRRFTTPIFLSYPGSNGQRFRLTNLSSDMKVVEEPGTSLSMLASGVVEFILENLQTGSTQSHRRGSVQMQ